MFATEYVRKVSDVQRADWERIYPDDLESYDFFKSLDESGLSQFEFYYILVHAGRDLVGVAPCFFMKYPLDTSISGGIRRFTNALRRRFPDILCLKALIAGLPMGKGQIGLAGDSHGVLEAILGVMEGIASDLKAAVIAFKDFDGSYSDLFSPLLKKGFVRIDSLPSAEMDIPFMDFEGYMKTLSGATRYDLRRKFKKVDGNVKIDLEITGAPAERDLSEMYKLYLGMVEEHEMGFEVVPEAFFRNVAKNMPEEARFFFWKMDGKVVAFLFSLVSGDVINDYYLGLDYSVARDYHLYFVKFRDVMNWCLSRGIKRYIMGVTGYEPKRRLGFDFVPLYIYVKFRNRALRPVMNLLVKLLNFENFDPELKKIKEKVS
ncbi:MAG: GNAT family N-acetyltransferase [Candidatus Omnitrophica bacterium]|nr:GNAT family N-acetyltransferase [Candidatus Omnitrophota bacterium]